MATTHANLWAARLTPEQHALTCGYWYTVTSNHAAHTAFVTRAGLDRWLSERGLALTADLAEPSACPVAGAYRTVMSYGPLPDAGLLTRTLSNGDWVEAVITTDPDGLRTVHTLNPNVRDRKTFDYRESNAMMS